MKQKVLFILLLCLPLIYILFILKYIPSSNSSFGNLSNFFGSDTFTSSKHTKNLFNFKKIEKYEYKIPILMYHYVEYNQNKEDFKRDQLNIEPHIFEQQINGLIANNYKFITTQELTEIINNNKPDNNNYVALTFDDGYRDFYTDVFPILKKYNVKATVYLIYNFLNADNYMYSWQVEEIIQSGLVEIGSHTLNHVYLKTDNTELITKEVTESKINIENAFNIKVNSFAYPYGAYNNLAGQQVEKAGYTNATTTNLGIISNQENIFILKRIRPGYNSGQGLVDYIEKLKDN